MPFFYMDYWYIILVIPAVIFALIAQGMVTSTFNKYSKIMGRRGITGADAARRILDANGLNHIRIEPVSGNLTDHFDPKAGVIRLSQSVYGSASVAAIGVAAHEAGHAVQHGVGYFPIKVRTAIIPICNIGSNLAMPLVLIGLLFSFEGLAMLGVLLFGLAVVFQLVTLPVEFNASSRALKIIDNAGMLDDSEIRGSKKVLTAAALTYVAALAVALANFLRLLFIVTGRSRRN